LQELAVDSSFESKDIDKLKIYQTLVTINTKIDVCFQQHSTPQKRDIKKLEELLKQLGFKIKLPSSL